MRYCITLEKTIRVARWFSAKDDESALKKAEHIKNTIDGEEYEYGDVEYDYALDCVDDGRTLTPWSR